MNDKINVCLINDSFPPLVDGVANTVVNYGRIINSDLGSASVATPYYPDTNDSKYNFDVVRFPSLDTSFLVGYRAGLAFSTKTISELKEKNFDIIHSHCPITASMLGRVLREEIDRPLVFTYHTKYDIDIQNVIRGHLLQEGALKLLVDNVAASDEVWVVSDGAGKNLQSIGYEGDYIVMPNGVDFPKGRVDDVLVSSVTQDYDLPEDVPVYMFVGRMMWYKGIKIILDALKQLKDSGKDFRMVFIGGGQDKDEIVAYAGNLLLDDKVFFVNPILDRTILRAWYCRANLFLFPSTFDTNGLVVREAAACALPSVLIEGSCAAEGTEDFHNAFWIKENSESLFELLNYVGSDFLKMSDVGNNAQKELYISWDDSIRRAYERYAVVIENYDAGRCPSHDSIGDLFFDKSADVISDILKLQNQGSDLVLSARSELEQHSQALKNVVNELKSANMSLVEFEKERSAKLRATIHEARRDFEEVNKKTIEFIAKQLDRYK